MAGPAARAFGIVASLVLALGLAAAQAQDSAPSRSQPAPAAPAPGPDEPLYLVAHTAVDCPVCKVWRQSPSGLALAQQLPKQWQHVRFVLIERQRLYGSEDESLYPKELRFLFDERRSRYMLSPPTPLFEVVVGSRVVLWQAGLQDWETQVVPAVRELEAARAKKPS